MEHVDRAPYERVSLISVNIPQEAQRTYLERYYSIDPARKATTSSTVLLQED
jgi:hypothetical protein